MLQGWANTDAGADGVNAPSGSFPQAMEPGLARGNGAGGCDHPRGIDRAGGVVVAGDDAGDLGAGGVGQRLPSAAQLAAGGIAQGHFSNERQCLGIDRALMSMPAVFAAYPGLPAAKWTALLT